MQRIIGIDIGLRFTGYGIIDFSERKEAIVEGGVIKNLEALANPDSLEQFKNIKELNE